MSTLELVIYNKKTFQVFTESDELIQEALKNLDYQLKAMPSLQSVIIRMNYLGGQTLSIKVNDFVQNFGWILFIGDDFGKSLT
jgi:hypothetical protein